MSQKKDAGNKGPLVSLLIYSDYYFLDCVYILREKGRFRLIVLHKGKVVKDSCYGTDRGAKIAFSKQFKKRSWRKEVPGNWTPFYIPDFAWWQGKVA